MGKRLHDEDVDNRPPKRAKPDHAPVAEEILFARQLQQLLTFRQDSIQQLRTGIAAFKSFLEGILYHHDEDARPRQLSILHEYLDSQKPSEPTGSEHSFLSQLWQAWSFANQANNDPIVSAVCAVLALLLKTLSSLLDFREYGILLCRAVLQHGNLRLIKRGLEAPRHREFMISPCLRLLTEVVSFDGGLLANEVYKRREQTFEISSLRRNLSLGKPSQEETKRAPSVRTNTLRYVLTHLKYQPEGPKADILKQRPLIGSIFSQLPSDPSEIISEVLKVVEQSVFGDGALQRSSKSAILTQQALEKVTEVARAPSAEDGLAEAALQWLLRVCTTPDYGVLRSSGWYPPGCDKLLSGDEDHDQDEEQIIDLGLGSIPWFDNGDLPIRNTTLSGYTQYLRPHASLQERRLVLAAFQAAPELVADYFSRRTIQLEPKLTNTWIGYASFLFSVVEMPLPLQFGRDYYAEMPPQSTVAIESLLPKPLTHKTLTRCLNQSANLITFFAGRVLVAAFQKLSRTLDMYKEGGSRAERPELWRDAAERLQLEFYQRVPAMKDVIATFRKTPDDVDHLLQRETVSRLLRLYYEVTPSMALDESFDISVPLTAALLRSQHADEDFSDTGEIQALTLAHLLAIAQRSPGMRWFHKQGSLTYSPFVTVLQLSMDSASRIAHRDLLLHIVREQGFLVLESTKDNYTSFDALLASLMPQLIWSHAPEVNDSVYAFLDECIGRVIRKPVKYLDDLDEIITLGRDLIGDATASSISLLVAVILEQTSFVDRIKDPEERKGVIAWIRRFMDLLQYTEAERRVLHVIDERIHEFIGEVYEIGQVHELSRMQLLQLAQPEEAQSSDLDVRTDSSDRPPSLPFDAPPVESDDHPILTRWAQKDIGEAIEDGAVAELIMCLCSQHESIRRQAWPSIEKLMKKVQASTIEHKDQVWLLLGELIETTISRGLDRALPYLTVAFAARALAVQVDPTHYMYPKFNGFLNKGPSWRVDKMASYWIDEVILATPDEDDGYWNEVQWIVDWLVDGLQSEEDMSFLRAKGVFERVMSLHSSPAAPKQFKEKVLELVFRATYVEDGSTTLITRVGVLSWLDMVTTVEPERQVVLRLLKERVLETCDEDRVKDWSGDAVYVENTSV